MSNHLFALQSDFGYTDGRAADLAGNILKLCPDASIYSVMHALPKGDVPSAALMIYSVLHFWPEGTIYVSIVEEDGAKGRPCAAYTVDNKYILTPDNGALSSWLDLYGVKELRALDLSLVPEGVEPYSYFAGALGSGKLAFADVGPAYPAAEAVRFKLMAPTVEDGYVKCVPFSVLRTFGNLNLNVLIDDFAKSGIAIGDNVTVTITRKGETLFEGRMPYNLSFGFAELGAPILFNGSNGFMGMGLNQENFAMAYMPESLQAGCDFNEYVIEIKK